MMYTNILRTPLNRALIYGSGIAYYYKFVKPKKPRGMRGFFNLFVIPGLTRDPFL